MVRNLREILSLKAAVGLLLPPAGLGNSTEVRGFLGQVMKHCQKESVKSTTSTKGRRVGLHTTHKKTKDARVPAQGAG